MSTILYASHNQAAKAKIVKVHTYYRATRQPGPTTLTSLEKCESPHFTPALVTPTNTNYQRNLLNNFHQHSTLPAALSDSSTVQAHGRSENGRQVGTSSSYFDHLQCRLPSYGSAISAKHNLLADSNALRERKAHALERLYNKSTAAPGHHIARPRLSLPENLFLRSVHERRQTYPQAQSMAPNFPLFTPQNKNESTSSMSKQQDIHTMSPDRFPLYTAQPFPSDTQNTYSSFPVHPSSRLFSGLPIFPPNTSSTNANIHAGEGGITDHHDDIERISPDRAEAGQALMSLCQSYRHQIVSNAGGLVMAPIPAYLPAPLVQLPHAAVPEGRRRTLPPMIVPGADPFCGSSSSVPTMERTRSADLLHQNRSQDTFTLSEPQDCLLTTAPLQPSSDSFEAGYPFIAEADSDFNGFDFEDNRFPTFGALDMSLPAMFPDVGGPILAKGEEISEEEWNIIKQDNAQIADRGAEEDIENVEYNIRDFGSSSRKGKEPVEGAVCSHMTVASNFEVTED